MMMKPLPCVPRVRTCNGPFNGQNSEKRLVSCGIPQWSCLGPLLFILHTNDFEESLTKFAATLITHAPHGSRCIFMRAQISIETETIVKFESLQTLHVSARGVTTHKTFTATTTTKGKGLMYIAQMELYRTNQNKNKTASLGPS